MVQKEFNKHVYAAIEVNGRTLTLENLTINAGSSYHALRVTNRGKVYLKDFILNGRNYGIRVLNNSIITLNNTTVNTDGSTGRDASNNCKATICGSGIVASANSSLILKSGNTLNFASSNDGDSGLIVFGNTSVSLQGKNNTINNLGVYLNTSFEQIKRSADSSNNRINGNLEVCAGSSMSLSGIDANAILVTSKKIDIDGNSSFEVDTWDDNNNIVNSVVIQPPQGETGQIQVESNSNLDFEVGGTIVMNVQLNNSSHMYTGSNTVIDGDLFVSTYSSYFAENSNIVVDPGTFNKSVSGGITCYNSQATDIDNSNSIYRSICPTN